MYGSFAQGGGHLYTFRFLIYTIHMFDTHCHLNFKRFKKNAADVIQNAHDSGVSLIVIPGTDVNTSAKAIELAQEHDWLYAAVGIHPHHVYKLLKRDDITVESELAQIDELLKSSKVVAVGEVGMDRHVYEETVYQEYNVNQAFIGMQRQLLGSQIDLAIKHKKSLILHNREARHDILPLLEEKWNSELEGRSVFHCCEPDEDLLKFAMDHSMYIGVDGDVTYDTDKQHFIKQVPLEMLVIETDSPYILPEPLLTEKKYPNEPKNIIYTAEKVAQIKGVSKGQLVEQTTENGKKLFAL